MNSRPLKALTCAVNSCLSRLPVRKFTSNTAALALPYSAGKAPVRKSLERSRLVFSALTGPPVVPSVLKWLVVPMGRPSTRQSRPVGELPRTTMSLRESLAPLTPAKLVASRATSLRPPE